MFMALWHNEQVVNISFLENERSMTVANIQEIDVSIGIDAILKNGFAWLEKHQWTKAKRHFDAAAEMAPENPYVYLGKLLITLKLPDIESLPYAPSSFAGSPNFKKALKYADDDLKQKLENYLSQYMRYHTSSTDTTNPSSTAKSQNTVEKTPSSSTSSRPSSSSKSSKPTKKIGPKEKILIGILVGVVTFIAFVAIGLLVGFLLWAFFVGLPLVIFFVFQGVELKKKNDEIKMQDYFRHKGKQEIEQLESFMQTSGILLPKQSDDKLRYMKSLLDKTLQHYQDILLDNLKKAGYTKHFQLNNVGIVYYNSKYALLYRDVFMYVEPSITTGVVRYQYRDRDSNTHRWTLSQVLEHCQKLEERFAYETLAKQIRLEDVYWYVEYPNSSAYKLGGIAASAVVGGILLGPVGALAGGMSANKNQNKEEKEKVEVIFGQKSGNRAVTSWSVAQGEGASKYMAEYLTKHLPNNRLPDTYKNQ